MGRLQTWLLPSCPGVVTALPSAVHRRADALHRTGDLAFFGDLTGLADASAFAAWLVPFRKSEWVVYSKPPFGGPEAVLAYLSRYDALQAAGFRLVFKEVSRAGEGIKGNVDVDLTIRAVDGCLHGIFDNAYLITSDGDYAGLVRYLGAHRKFGGVLSAERKTCSILRKAAKGKIAYLDEFSHKIDLK